MFSGKGHGSFVQAMPLLEGKVNLETGTYEVQELIHCVAKDDVTGLASVRVYFKDEKTLAPTTSAVVEFSEMQDFSFSGTIDIIKGKFHIS